MADLQLISLEIDNFKSYSGKHSFALDQRPGLYLIQGKNELAPELGANGVGKSTIFDALLWVLWGKTARDNRPAAAIQPWGSEKETTRTELLFQRGGLNHTLYRSRAPNKLTVEIEGHTELEIQQEEIPKLLGMSEETFRRSMILGQFGTLFLDLKPEAQSQMFTEALGLDIWLGAVDRASAAEKAASKDKEQAEHDLIYNRALVDGLNTQIAESATAAKRFEVDKAARITKIGKGIKTLETDLAELKEVKEPEIPTDAEHAKLTAALGEIKTEQALLNRSVRDTGSEVEDAEADYQKYAGQAKAKQKTCPLCAQPIPDKDFKDKLTAAKRIWDDLRANYQTLLERQQTCASDVGKAEAAVSRQAAAFEKNKKGYSEKLAAFSSYRDQLRAIQAELSKQKGLFSAEERSTNIFQQSVDVNKTRREEIQGKIADLNTAKANADIDIEEAKFWVMGFREIRMQIIDDTLVELEMAANRHAQMLGLTGWEIRFLTERESKKGEVSYAFTVLLYPPDQEHPVKWESYSGGESQRWQLACSFALSEVLLARAGVSPNIEVLDEPSKGLSPSGIEDLIEHLRDRALELGRAIYFIDHHSLDKGAFDGVMEVTKSKKGSTAKWL